MDRDVFLTCWLFPFCPSPYHLVFQLGSANRRIIGQWAEDIYPSLVCLSCLLCQPPLSVCPSSLSPTALLSLGSGLLYNSQPFWSKSHNSRVCLNNTPCLFPWSSVSTSFMRVGSVGPPECHFASCQGSISWQIWRIALYTLKLNWSFT